ncbi:CapA family protein [Zoogloea sp. LCSB751]|uniref:CapA family protein n=1 Tax=Zoogloea sp. LCSB751 TaxID=1965277 RepID=UPI0009A50C98|nr:CapA family protein [Zoogloea sp. LCSB751]
MKKWLASAAMLAGLCGVAQGVQAEELRILFAGDIMLADGPGKAIAAGRDPLAAVAPLLAGADYRIGNLECAVAKSGTPIANKPYVFRAEPDVVKVLKGRFDAVAVANNHAGDFGKAAFVETMEHVAAAGIGVVGGGRNLAEAHRPLWIKAKGLRIAILAYNEFKPRSFEAGATTPGIAWSEDSEVISDIRAAKRAGADLVIPFMHWGWEYEPVPGARQRLLARRMIDAGASAVVGGHPHVTQGAEIYKGRPIIYSLGNFVFDGFDFPEAQTGWLLQFSVDRRGVRRWHTVEAHMDGEGLPTLAPDALTPCGARGDRHVRQCRGGAELAGKL